MIATGDKVICLDQSFTRFEKMSFLPRVPEKGWKGPIIYSVREVLPDPVNGGQLVRLVGIHGVAENGGPEPAFAAARFRRVSRTDVGKPLDVREAVQIAVPVTLQIFRDLQGIGLTEELEAVVKWDDEVRLAAVCRRWAETEQRARPLSEYQTAIAAEIVAGESAILPVALSPLGMQNLAGISERLEIPAEVWLQGALGYIASRIRRARNHQQIARRGEEKRKR